MPTTFSGVLQLCSAAQSKGKVAFALGAATPSNTQLIDYALVPSLVYAKDPNFNAEMSKGKATFNAHAKHPNAAQLFLNFLSSPEQQNSYAKNSNSVPAIANAKSAIPTSIATIGEYQKENKTFGYPDQYWPNAQVQQAHLTGMQEVLSGQGTPAEVLQSMDTAYKG